MADENSAQVIEAPGEAELGETLLWAAHLAVEKRLVGEPPRGMEREDLVCILALRSVRVCSRWRPGGKKTLREYCYMKCCFELYEVLDALKHPPAKKLDALDAPGTVGLRHARLIPAATPDNDDTECSDSRF